MPVNYDASKAQKLALVFSHSGPWFEDVTEEKGCLCSTLASLIQKECTHIIIYDCSQCNHNVLINYACVCDRVSGPGKEDQRSPGYNDGGIEPALKQGVQNVPRETKESGEVHVRRCRNAR